MSPKQAGLKDPFPALLALLTMKNSHIVYPQHQATEHIERLLVANSSLRAKITPLFGDHLATIQVLKSSGVSFTNTVPSFTHLHIISARPGIHKNVAPMYYQLGLPWGRLWCMQEAFQLNNDIEQLALINRKFYYLVDKPHSR
jgi:hypothetical protein